MPYEGGAPTRATGTQGHRNSVDYVVQRLRAAGYQPQLQPFEADIFVEESAAFARNGVPYPRYDGETGVWYTADFSGTGDATAAAVADASSPSNRAHPAAAPATPQLPCGCAPARSEVARPLRAATS